MAPASPPKSRITLFETFETTKPEGMGLGLPLALQIARRHSGSLTWRALKPQGARFSLTCPFKGRGKMPTKRLVHVVDDEPDIRRALALMLHAARIETRVYGSAEEYLAEVSISEPACVLLDNRLPGLSGLELLKQFSEAQSDASRDHDDRARRCADRSRRDEIGGLPFR